ncbi:MAG: hypothetical protein B7Y48_06055 [Methylophilales bacterium 28-44-11]|jgi:hypothetical protein|nr:MAG: hypothetical protein B7Y48_06055 [Methylophilales bacterium 28-44-11]
MPKSVFAHFSNFPKPLLGDWCVILLSLALILWSFSTLWSQQPAATLRIRMGNVVLGEYSLMQTKTLSVNGPMGKSIIEIAQGKVRFKQSPCHNQYCVHQGWLARAHQAAICIPNQISIELMGASPAFDTLNY